MNTTTNSGVADAGQPKAALSYDTDDAAAVFLKGWETEDNPEDSSKPTEEENADLNEEISETEDDVENEETDTDLEEDTDTETEDDTEESEDEQEEEKEPPKKAKSLGDDDVVTVKVDDKELKVPVKDLKRLYGQEAALTKKSQQVAEKRKEVEQDAMKTAAILDKMYNKAAERWKPYSEVDMLVASKQLDTEQFQALRQEANAAWEDFKFVSEEATNFIKQSQEANQAKLKEAAQESVKVLKEKIPNWNSNLYDSIREYAVSKGMPQDMVNNLVDPAAIELIHKARTYDESKKIATKKKVSQPKKVMKTTAMNDPKSTGNTQSKAKAEQRFRATGDLDDAADLFLSRWAEDK